MGYNNPLYSFSFFSLVYIKSNVLNLLIKRFKANKIEPQQTIMIMNTIFIAICNVLRESKVDKLLYNVHGTGMRFICTYIGT